MTGAGGAAAMRLIGAGEDIPVDTSRVPAREAARDELSDPMYHEHDPNLLERGLDRFWDWIGDLFAGAAGAAPPRPHRPGGGGGARAGGGAPPRGGGRGPPRPPPPPP
ncbi:hypothetical protein ACFW0I_31955, partial [[Kitasatospora] papulosa]